jgi:hypothetical protein
LDLDIDAGQPVHALALMTFCFWPICSTSYCYRQVL